ncbi:unnamed protein product [Pleuronectes platessa]|uniref:Uncharacterized protein n=1 Tax=Pleuronectes platessa TaxID=8262 RepID=A0A9N7YQ80_PLEPL|nr:unnamed protein product [Pleuronectes platessa]
MRGGSEGGVEIPGSRPAYFVTERGSEQLQSKPKWECLMPRTVHRQLLDQLVPAHRSVPLTELLRQLGPLSLGGDQTELVCWNQLGVSQPSRCFISHGGGKRFGVITAKRPNSNLR